MKLLSIFLIIFTSLSAMAFSWNKVLTCDGGAAVVDVNDFQRNSVQVVIRDPNVVRYIQSKYYANEFPQSSEVILSGLNARDVYNGSDFQYISLVSFGKMMWEAYRENQGLKVRFYRTISDTNSDCPNYVPCKPDYQAEVANWYFNSCQ